MLCYFGESKNDDLATKGHLSSTRDPGRKLELSIDKELKSNLF